MSTKGEKTSNLRLTHYRRALRGIWPHRRYLIVACIAALGVSLTYAASVSTIYPMLKVMFNQETLGDWVYRTVAQARLDCTFVTTKGERLDGLTSSEGQHPTTQPVSDVLLVETVGQDCPVSGLKALQQIAAIDGKRYSRGALCELIATLPDSTAVRLTVVDYQTGVTETTFTTRPTERWHRLAIRAAGWLPTLTGRTRQMQTLIVVMAGLVVIAFVAAISRFVHEYSVALVCERTMMDLRTQAYTNLLRLPMAWFSQQQTGDTMSRFARDTAVVQLGIQYLLVKVLRESLKAFAVVGLVVAMNWQLLVMVCIVGPVAGALIYRLGKRIRRAQRKALLAWGVLVDLLDEKVGGINIVKAYHMERHERRRFFREHRRMLKQQLKIARTDAATAPSLEFIGTVAVAGFVLYGGYQVSEQNMDPARFILSVGCLVAIFDPIRKLANINNRLQSADAAAQRVYEVIDHVPEEPIDASTERIVLGRLAEQIEFRNVSFSYPARPEALVLSDVNLVATRGQVTAIVGPNGSGKSTLCSLLMRFYEPDHGQVLFDGVDIAGVSLGSLRRQIGFVSQDSVTFTDSVRNNIAYGCPDASEAQIVSAARTAHADDFIGRLRTERGGQVLTGYDAIISTRTLSGGQRQRLAIARAILNDPAILIFDEATSQVDSESEQKIQEALHEIMQGRTTFVIAHRLSTIAEADQIAVMDAGRIVACGAHGDLVDSCDLYRTLYERQFRNAD